MSTNWASHCIWWHVYPLGFTGAPIREAEPPLDHGRPPRLRALENWLDYAIELGTSGLLLGPVFASESHGYDSIDQYRIDPRLGGTSDLERLISACHERGLRVLLDGVFNHVGAAHPWVTRALSDGPGGKYADFFRVDWEDPAAPRAGNFEGHSSLVTLNHDNPAVADYVVEVMTTWLDRGIDGWRLDAAYAVPTSFWAEVLPRVRELHPDAWFLGEVIHGDYASFAADSTIDSITQYQLWKAIWSSIKDRNYWELAAALDRHNEFLGCHVPATFVGNHDVTRIATQVGQPGAILALVVLMTVGGIPSIYCGDEQGYTGVKEERIGGDDQIRPQMPDYPEDLSRLGMPIYRLHQELIGLRRRHPWLVTARTRQLELSNTRFVYLVQAAPDSQEGAAAHPSQAAHSAELRVELDLTAGFGARILSADGCVLFEFAG